LVDHHLRLRDFGLRVIICMNVCVVIKVATVGSSAVKGFWASVVMVMLLTETYYGQVLTPRCKIILEIAVHEIAKRSNNVLSHNSS
jgi:hypothetical protein